MVGWRRLAVAVTWAVILGTGVSAQAGDAADCSDALGLIKIDLGRVEQACRRLAELGNAVAEHNLGFMYFTGRGIQQDYGEAMRWFRKSADQGYGPAQNNIGSMYLSGKGVRQDYAEAMR